MPTCCQARHRWPLCFDRMTMSFFHSPKEAGWACLPLLFHVRCPPAPPRPQLKCLLPSRLEFQWHSSLSSLSLLQIVVCIASSLCAIHSPFSSPSSSPLLYLPPTRKTKVSVIRQAKLLENISSFIKVCHVQLSKVMSDISSIYRVRKRRQHERRKQPSHTVLVL